VGKFKDWASKPREALPQRLVTPAQQKLVDPMGAPIGAGAVAPQPQPRGQLYYAPAPPPVAVYLSQGTVAGRQTTAPIDPIGKTCFLVRTDCDHGDPYEKLMSNIPDMAKQAGLQPPETDAMKMTSVPQGAEMAQWTDRTKYYNQVTDRSSDGDFTGHRGKRDRELVG